MPWCEDCAKYWAPSSMRDDGACPTCERVLEAPMAASTVTSKATPKVTAKTVDVKRLAAGDDGDLDDVKAPWHFKLLMVLLVIYLGWRIIDLVI